MQKNILIYPHLPFRMNDGGLIALYYLASVLNQYGLNARIYPVYGKIENPICNQYYNNDFDLKNSITVYCEGTQGNPLGSRYVVRWMLSELGKRVGCLQYRFWGKRELVYYFNPELKFQAEPSKNGVIYKLLTVNYLNPAYKNFHQPRSGYCHTYRKKKYFPPSKSKSIQLKNSFEITRAHGPEDYVRIFNQYQYFVSYDPLTYLSVIAALCGCISIVNPLEGIDKQTWLKANYIYPYMKEHNLDGPYGIAYGLEDVDYAEKTIHLAQQQWVEISRYFLEKTVLPFINDLNHFKAMKNTVDANYYRGFDSITIPVEQSVFGSYIRKLLRPWKKQIINYIVSQKHLRAHDRD